MRPVRISLNALGHTQWVPIDYIESWFGVSVAVVLSFDGNLGYDVEHTFDDPRPQTDDPYQICTVSISRSGTVATVTDAGPNGIGHGLIPGDSVIVTGSGSTYLDSQPAAFGTGTVGWTITGTPTTTSYTYTVANSGPTSDNGNAKVSRQRVFNEPNLTNLTARASDYYAYPIKAVRLYIKSYTAGFADLLVLQGLPR